MSPPPFADLPCEGCFLYERRGVCPVAREAYGLETPAEVQWRAEALHAAVLQDAGTVPGLRELMRLDAQRPRPVGLLVPPSRLVLPSTAAERMPNDSQKEAIPHAHAPRTPR